MHCALRVCAFRFVYSPLKVRMELRPKSLSDATLNFLPKVTSRSWGAAHGADTFALKSPLNYKTRKSGLKGFLRCAFALSTSNSMCV